MKSTSTTNLQSKSLKTELVNGFYLIKNAFEISYHDQTKLYNPTERCQIHQTFSLLFGILCVYLSLRTAEITWKTYPQWSYVELLSLCYFFHKTGEYAGNVSYRYLDNLSKHRPEKYVCLESDNDGRSYLTAIDLTNDEEEYQETSEYSYESEEQEEEDSSEEQEEESSEEQYSEESEESEEQEEEDSEEQESEEQESEEQDEEDSSESQDKEEESSDTQKQEQEQEPHHPLQNSEVTEAATTLTQLRRSSRCKNKTE